MEVEYTGVLVTRQQVQDLRHQIPALGDAEHTRVEAAIGQALALEKAQSTDKSLGDVPDLLLHEGSFVSPPDAEDILQGQLVFGGNHLQDCLVTALILLHHDLNHLYVGVGLLLEQSQDREQTRCVRVRVVGDPEGAPQTGGHGLFGRQLGPLIPHYITANNLSI